MVAEHPVIQALTASRSALRASLSMPMKPPLPAAFLDALFIAHADHSLDQNYCTPRTRRSDLDPRRSDDRFIKNWPFKGKRDDWLLGQLRGDILYA